MTPAELARARRHLSRHDDALAPLIRRIGGCRLVVHDDGDLFELLLRAIASQQLSARAGQTIYGRLRALLPPGGTPRAADVLALAPDALRATGMSRMKCAFVHDLARHVAGGDLDLAALRHLPDAEVIAALTRVKGIGRWSAEMFLIFSLGRPDVLPVDDVGVLRAVQQLYGLRTRPTAARLERLAEPWRPWRSVACWYLWRMLDG
jgi:DNA-3-methyladenine glycosylase II